MTGKPRGGQIDDRTRRFVLLDLTRKLTVIAGPSQKHATSEAAKSAARPRKNRNRRTRESSFVSRRCISIARRPKTVPCSRPYFEGQQNGRATSNNVGVAIQIPKGGRVAGEDKPEWPPLLPAGFHDIDQEGRKRLCVDRFPNSITRKRILANLEDMIGEINRHAIPGAVWIDGSFVTEKLNPDDADVALVIDAGIWPSLSATQQAFFSSFAGTSKYDQYRIDNYGVPLDWTKPEAEWRFAYWLKQFGFSRRGELKGIIKVGVPFLVRP